MTPLHWRFKWSTTIRKGYRLMYFSVGFHQGLMKWVSWSENWQLRARCFLTVTLKQGLIHCHYQPSRWNWKPAEGIWVKIKNNDSCPCPSSLSTITHVHQDLLLTNFIIYWLKVPFLWQEAVTLFPKRMSWSLKGTLVLGKTKSITNALVAGFTLNDLLPSAHWISLLLTDSKFISDVHCITTCFYNRLLHIPAVVALCGITSDARSPYWTKPFQGQGLLPYFHSTLW